MTAGELKKFLELILLAQQGLQEALEFIKNKQLQNGETTEQIEAHAELTTQKVKDAIANL